MSKISNILISESDDFAKERTEVYAKKEERRDCTQEKTKGLF